MICIRLSFVHQHLNTHQSSLRLFPSIFIICYLSVKLPFFFLPICFPPSRFLWLSCFISYVPVFIFPSFFVSSYILSPCCCWHCGLPVQVEQHSSPLCLNDLTSNSDRPCLSSPPSLPLRTPFSSTFPHCFLFLLLLALPSALSLFPSPGHFPRASVWSPWWLKGFLITASCHVKVKLFFLPSTREPFHLVLFPSFLSTPPLLCCWLCAQKMPTPSFPTHFILLCTTCFFLKCTFLRSTYQSTIADCCSFKFLIDIFRNLILSTCLHQ